MHYQESKIMFKFNRSSDLDHRQCSSFSGVAQRMITLVAILGAGVAVMGAQTSTPASSQIGTVAQQPSAQAQPSLNFQIPVSDALFSSSADENAGAPTLEASVTPIMPDFAKMMQYGRGQGYNPARYRSSYMNADGSNKAIFYIAGGASVALGNTQKYLTDNFGLEVGAGPQFNKHLAVPIEYDFNYFGLTRQALDNQVDIYDSLFSEPHAVNGRLGGNSHIWSFSLQPTYTVHSGDSWGEYVVAGVGFYHKVANFTLPSNFDCGFYNYSCGYFNLDHYTSNAPGYDGGIGVTYRVSPGSSARFYAEARYVFIDNSQRTGITNNSASIASINSSTTDFYPANSNHTTYIPVVFGVRF
jgi:hypothetical protein